MTGKPDPDKPKWDKLFDSLNSEDETASIEAVESELKGRGIDVERVKRTVLDAVRKAQARADLEQAASGLAQAKQKLGNATIPSESIKTVEEMIKRQHDPALQQLYFSKLKQAASSADLQSLIEDLRRLDLLEGDNNDDQSSQPQEG
jgi:hypothetical protein